MCGLIAHRGFESRPLRHIFNEINSLYRNLISVPHKVPLKTKAAPSQVQPFFFRTYSKSSKQEAMCYCTNRSQDQSPNIKARRYHDYRPKAAQAHKHKLHQYSTPARTHTHACCKLVLYDGSSFATRLPLSA